MELSLAEETQVVCNMLDIPVRPGHSQALHMLFTLFDFRESSISRSVCAHISIFNPMYQIDSSANLPCTSLK